MIHQYIKTFIIALLCMTWVIQIQAQELLRGTIHELTEEKKLQPLAFANVMWLGTDKAAVSDENGQFSLARTEKSNRLIVRFVGYKNDTLTVEPSQQDISIILTSNPQLLQSVEIKGKLDASFISRLQPIKTEIITTAGLNQLACCNLAESFENSLTVDVGYSDAVSGARQIQMLGLTGIYSQLLLENIPFLRGLSAPFGLSYVPGSFMESIQVSKGAASVINGYESITGQINLEYKKPQKSDPFFLNLYLNSDLRAEMNAIARAKLNDRLSTSVLAHASYFGREIDHVGHDGFMDTPKSNQINVVNRWAYDADKYHNITVLNFVNENRLGGQMGFNEDKDKGDTVKYGIGINTQRFYGSTKNGFMLGNDASIGTQVSASYLNQDAYYGLTTYKGTETEVYFNAILEKPFSEKHKLSTGLSAQYNQTKEDFFRDSLYLLTKNEFVPGVFAQYAFNHADIISAIVGLRYDYNTYFEKGFVTPRIHAKYSPTETFSIRISGGKGYRTPNQLAENFGLMASSRKFHLEEHIKQEEAWNYGINIVKDFKFIGKRTATFTVDAYRTDFINQLVVDIDKSVHDVYFYNLTGQSYANSLQGEFKFEPLKQFNVTIAGRYNDVRMTLDESLQSKPLISPWKGLLVLSYATKYDKWMFDFTTQFNGKCRLPKMHGSHESTYSDPYLYLLGQVTRKFKYFDIYAGCENITNYVQEHPIMAADKPFGPNFDASIIWAPLMGRTFYVGLRWTIQ